MAEVTKIAGAGATGGGGTYAWANPGNITAEDDTSAIASDQEGNGGDTDPLLATSFGFAIPADATIVGITATIRRLRGGQFIQDKAVRLIVGGTVSGDDKSAGDIWPITAPNYVEATYGGPDDLWGLPLSPEDVNASDFGLAFVATLGFATASVDSIEITIHYTEASGETGSVGSLINGGLVR